MVIRQGELYWVNLPEPRAAEPGFRRPCLIIQNDLLNSSRIKTVVVCVLTSTIKRAQSPGNVLLEAAEAGLPQASVVNISQVLTINKDDLLEKIGKISTKRMKQVADGLHFLVEPQEVDETDLID